MKFNYLSQTQFHLFLSMRQMETFKLFLLFSGYKFLQVLFLIVHHISNLHVQPCMGGITVIIRNTACVNNYMVVWKLKGRARSYAPRNGTIPCLFASSSSLMFTFIHWFRPWSVYLRGTSGCVQLDVQSRDFRTAISDVYVCSIEALKSLATPQLTLQQNNASQRCALCRLLQA